MARCTITVDRSAKELDIVVSDNGVGLPDGFAVEQASGLGLQIVRTLVEAELLGIDRDGPTAREQGTAVRIVVPLRGRSDLRIALDPADGSVCSGRSG